MNSYKHTLPTKRSGCRKVNQISWAGFTGRRDKTNFIRFTNAATDHHVEKLVSRYMDYVRKTSQSRGRLKTVVHMKEIYNVALRYSAGIRFEPIPFCRTNSDNLPRFLTPWRKDLKGSYNRRRAILGVLQLYKLISTPEAQYSISTITDPYRGELNPIWLPTFKATLEQTFPSELREARIGSLRGSLKISGKNGPNGPAMVTLHVDRKALRGSKLLEDIRTLAALTNNDELLTILSLTQPAESLEFAHRKGHAPAHSRLRVKHESGGKARVFATLDNFSQSSLKPIHNFLMNWLNRNPKDGTESHATAANAVKRWTGTNHKIWSFDLTSATDRYPLFLQEIVMQHLFGSEIKSLWKNIISNREFIKPEGNGSVRYSVGQPMGALSSWATFAVTHHIHIMTAAKLANARPDTYDYRIIGDDIAIFRNAGVAKWYIRMMTDLSVPFSTAKSIVPSDCTTNKSVAELAKRVFVGGIELSPIPPDSIIELMRSPLGKKALILLGEDRDYNSLCSPYSVQSFLNYEDYGALTIPVGKTLSLLKGVKVVLSTWEDSDESPPGGVHPLWNYWYNQTKGYIADEAFTYLLIWYVADQLETTTTSVLRNISELNRSEVPTWAEEAKVGDWKPRIWEIENTLPTIVSYMSANIMREFEFLQEYTKRIRGNDPSELFEALKRLHSIITIEDLYRKHRFEDEKLRNLSQTSEFLKHCIRVRRRAVERAYLYS